MKLANVFWKDARVDHKERIELSDLHPEHVHLAEEVTQKTHLKESQKLSEVVAALPFHNATSLIQVCKKEKLRISQVVFKNELQWRTAEEVTARTLHLWEIMNQSILNGIQSKKDYLPGQLQVKRRAPKLFKKLMGQFADYAGLSQDFMKKTEISERITETKDKQITPVLSRMPKKRLPALDWISLYALAVNEENAAGGNIF
jgi:L-serine dehydratase